MDNLIHELEKLTLNDKLFVIERTLKSIRKEHAQHLEKAVESLYNDYKNDSELTVFTELDKEPFYETR